jgi:hypothetical protein
MSKLIVKASKPRNPLVAAARFRHAGPHGAGTGGQRRDARRALRRELATLDLPRSSLRSKPPSL